MADTQNGGGGHGRGAMVGVVAAIAATMALVSGVGGDHGRSATPPSASAVSYPRHRPSHDALCKLLRDHYALGTGNDACAEAKRRFRRAGSLVIVATVPDPVESRLGAVFDEMVEAFDLAAVEAGYEADGYAIPWATGAPAAAQESRTRLDGANETLWHRRGSQARVKPGALLFRRAVPTPDAPLLLVLLVGENATSGVHPKAFRHALDFACEVGPADAPIRLLGPTYSGSARSVADGFDAWRARLRERDESHETNSGACRRAFDALSGSATNPQVAEILRRNGDTFLSMQIPDDVLRRHMLEFLRKSGAEDRDVALLVESGTSYAESFATGSGPDPANASARKPPAANDADSGPLIVHYPLHLAQLRTERDRQLGPDGAGVLGFDANARAGLALPLAAPLARDVPPSQSPVVSANRAEIELEQSLGLLRTRGVRFVGLVGSDVEDVLFLAHEVRQELPDAQIFTASSDLLYIHPRHVADFLGAWVFSTYSPAPSSQAWDSGPDGRRSPIAFSSTNQEGAFDALLALVADASPSRWEELLDKMRGTHRRATRGSASPAIWISVVGRDAIWPKDRLEIAATEEATKVEAFAWPAKLAPWRLPASDAQSPRRLASLSFLLFLTFVLAGSAMLAALALDVLPWGLGARICARLPALTRLLAPRDPDGRAWLGRIGVHVAVAGVVVAWLAVASAGTPAWAPPNESPSDFAAGLQWILGVVAFVALCSPVVGLLGCAGGPLLERLLGSRRAAAVGVGLASLLFLGGFRSAALDVFAHGFDLERILWYRRSTALASGLSMLVPVTLLGAAAVVAGLASGRRRRLDACRAGVDCFADAGDPVPGHLADRVCLFLGMPPSFLRRAPRHTEPLARALPWIAAGIVATSLVLGTSRWHVRTPDPIWLELFVVSLGLAIAARVTADAVRCVQSWLSLRRLLRALAAGPLADAFDRLPPTLARSFGLSLHERPLDAVQLRRSLDAVSRLEALAKDAGGELADELRRAAKENDLAEGQALAPELCGVAAEGRPTFAFETQLARRLASLARTLSERLDATNGFSVNLSGDTPAAGGSTGRIAVAKLREATEDFVAGEETRFLSFVFAHMKAMATSAVFGICALLLAAGSYPLQPQNLILNAVLAGLVVIVGLVLMLLVQVERDDLLSRIANRTPNRVDWDMSFVTQIGLYVALPVATVLVTHFPALGAPLADLVGWIHGG
ncbi:MAG TPA: hypothetical protein VMW35_11475 [Myxococcota bacterium]|nr:hypothetical protein [Myxococcota bacterium]